MQKSQMTGRVICVFFCVSDCCPYTGAAERSKKWGGGGGGGRRLGAGMNGGGGVRCV